MRILLTKLTGERHRLEINRADGSAESVELETRSFLLHDLVHYAVETEAGIGDASGACPARHHDGRPLRPHHATAPERRQSLWNGRLDPGIFLEHDASFIDRVRSRLRALWGL